MRDSLRKAVGYEDNYLPPDVFVVAAQRLYVLEVETGDLGGALKTFERLRDSEDARESENYAQSIEVLGAHVERIRDLAEGPDLLAFAGEVGAFDYWVHNLLRRSFSIRGVDGELEIVDIRCSRGTVRYPWGSEDDVWNVPESWGDCGVYVKGAVGTKFSLYEYPAEA